MYTQSRFLRRIIKSAANKFIKDETFKVQKKGEGDFVTDTDKKIEEFLIKKIRRKFPRFDIISEEFNPKDELSRDCFVIDPIDGTNNFIAGLPLWGIQIAMVIDYKTVSCVIYLPKFREMYWADENGAYRNGKKIKRKTSSNLFAEEGHREPHTEKEYRRTACAALNYTWAAMGYLRSFRLHKKTLWDNLPGQFLVEKSEETK
ncbi:MAG: inositol monophosphatase [Christensenellaceae bacterium]|jgi:fructose-1,6-bisphosphatase/inositol monophosphatase family enzyme|nr:inositol monophosphatase [Christensenellaceae bacterium]